MGRDVRKSDSGSANEPRRRRLLVAVPAMIAALGLAAACNQASSPSAKSPTEQAAQNPPTPKPADAKPADPKPAAAAPAGGKPTGKTSASPPSMAIDPNKTYTAVIKTS